MARSRHTAMTVLFTCIGRRVSLLESFRNAASQLKVKARFLGTDRISLTAAMQLCDRHFIVKSTAHPGYIRQLLSIVRSENVKLLVPTVDLDLKILAENKDKFAALDCTVLVSKPGIIDICQDKRKTYRFLTKNGFDTPATMAVSSALAAKHNWPCFLKPWDGYASRGNYIVSNRKELKFYAGKVPNCIVQEFVEGVEYTCDVFVDFDMKVRCVIPRKRIEVRSGEVSKAQVVKNTRIMKQTTALIETLKAGPGVITVQLIMTARKQIKFIEINPRFGGGVPLSIKAGANFPKWILQHLIGKNPRIKFDGFTDKLFMLRYDSEVWLSQEAKK